MKGRKLSVDICNSHSLATEKWAVHITTDKQIQRAWRGDANNTPAAMTWYGKNRIYLNRDLGDGALIGAMVHEAIHASAGQLASEEGVEALTTSIVNMIGAVLSTE